MKVAGWHRCPGAKREEERGREKKEMSEAVTRKWNGCCVPFRLLELHSDIRVKVLFDHLVLAGTPPGNPSILRTLRL